MKVLGYTLPLYVVIPGALLGLIMMLLLGYVAYPYVNPSHCQDVSRVPDQDGSQGFRLWTGESLKSFEHGGRSICIPAGWEALGANTMGDGWARFPWGKTGVLIKSDSFSALPIEATGSYDITLRFPKDVRELELATYQTLIENAVNRNAELFGDGGDSALPHTMLVTAGLSELGFVYPDPSEHLTIIMRPANDVRGEELLIHAISHLYNRFSGQISYTSQSPFSHGEFEELVSTWTETAFSTVSERQRGRVEYLYRIHTAVMVGDFSLITEPPFNDEVGFRAIEPTIFADEGKPLDIQYGHYVLAPLFMIAVDGLLAEQAPEVSVERILRDIHVDSSVSFMDRLEMHLTEADMATLQSYAEGNVQIPWDTIQRGLARYQIAVSHER
jgi:hypothetical protein